MSDLDPKGTQYIGEYRLIRTLGQGGMGQVYLGRHDQNDMLAAVKIIHSHLADDPWYRHRFREEAGAWGSVSKGHTAELLGFSLQAEPAWLATEYLAAPTLQEVVDRAGGLPLPAVHSLAVHLGKTLAALERKSILHRDLKPSNILVTAAGPKVIDFGLARDSGHPMTRSGPLAGTPGYMSPEQQRHLKLTHATDVYSLGITLAFSATGLDPRSRLGADGLVRRDPDGTPAFPGLADELRVLIADCTREEPLERLTPGQIVAEVTRRAGGAARLDWPGCLPDEARRLIEAYAEADPEVGPVAPRRPKPRPPTRKDPHPRKRTPWTFRLGGAGYHASPVLRRDGVVHVGSQDGVVHALDAANGRVVWRFPTEKKIDHTPLLCGGLLIVPSADHHLYGLRARTGEVGWKVPLGPAVAHAPGPLPVTGREDDPYFVVGDSRGTVSARRVATGEQIWHFQADQVVETRPAAAAGRVFVGSHDHRLYALDAFTGEEVWRFDAGASVTSAPVVADGVVYIGCASGHLFAVDADKGKRRWDFQTGGAIHSRVAPRGGLLYFGSNDHCVYALDVTDGQVRWRCSTGGEVRSSPAVHHGRVYFGSRDFHVHAVDARTGRDRASVKTADWVDSTPVVGGSVLYVGSWEPTLHAIELAALRGRDGSRG
ncbi:hypothetical protein GCM10010191_52130 [Actinomadura vinacea]|uniref:Protein kinase domain-containing protein n=1 Tax=Actinomadura vinacea TaxID=115336 RepID=A0ABP5WNC3_9ACTN